LVVILGIIVTGTAFIGLLGVIGALRFARCENCDRLEMLTSRQMLHPCMHCRHERLFHPVEALHLYGAHVPHN
ncbi:MAG TPA: hypothetical protein VKB69_06560, partial [Micromonosporaceae bacterium]|nr:hypothetical protein [Micromonosporaceae bacterium]